MSLTEEQLKNELALAMLYCKKMIRGSTNNTITDLDIEWYCDNRLCELKGVDND